MSLPRALSLVLLNEIILRYNRQGITECKKIGQKDRKLLSDNDIAIDELKYTCRPHFSVTD